MNPPRNQRLSKIANTRVYEGFKDRNSAMFFDRHGNPIPNCEVIREVDEGWRYFWGKRGRVPPAMRRGLLLGDGAKKSCEPSGDAPTSYETEQK